RRAGRRLAPRRRPVQKLKSLKFSVPGEPQVRGRPPGWPVRVYAPARSGVRLQLCQTLRRQHQRYSHIQNRMKRYGDQNAPRKNINGSEKNTNAPRQQHSATTLVRMRDTEQDGSNQNERYLVINQIRPKVIKQKTTIENLLAYSR